MITIPLRRLSTIPITSGLGLAGSESVDSDPRYIRTTDIASATSLKADGRVSQPWAVAKEALVERGDLLLTSAGASIGKSLLYQSDEPACFAGFLTRIRPFSDLDGRFLSYWTQSRHFMDQVRRGAVQATIQNFSASRYKDLRVPVIDESKRRRIVEFLDAELEQIDALTAEQERLVSLFTERRTAVAEGLVSRADSKEIRNRGIFRHVDRKSKTGEEELLSVSHITGVTPRSEKNVTMFEAESKIGYNLVEPGELVINTMWAWMGALGVSDFEGIVSPSYDIYEFIDRGEFCPEYFDMLYRTDRYIGLMKAHSRGIWESRLRLYPDVFLSLTSPVPSLEAQQQIAHEYRVKCAEIDELLSKVQSLTSLLEEQKQALITAAVTGELEV